MCEKTATFIGHDICTGVDVHSLQVEIEKLIHRGIDCFLCGGMGRFDRLCAHLVRKAQGEYPHIRCCLVLPYLSFSYAREDYDESIYPEGFESYYFKTAIVKRNQYMVENASVAICYVRHAGGAAKTYAYATKIGIETINLGERK